MKNLDPYTKLLEGSSLEKYEVLRKGKYGGVGIQIGLRRDTLTVLTPFEDSPAYSEGIHSGDQILLIDSEAVSQSIVAFSNVSLRTIVNALFEISRGPTSILKGIPFISHSLNLKPGEIFSLLSK